MSSQDSNKALVVITTVAVEADAVSLAKSVLETGLAACVQVIPAIRSLYVWKGEIADDRESLLLIKTTKGLYNELESFILARHQYETPEILAIPVESVFSGYLEWLLSNVKQT